MIDNIYDHFIDLEDDGYSINVSQIKWDTLSMKMRMDAYSTIHQKINLSQDEKVMPSVKCKLLLVSITRIGDDIDVVKLKSIIKRIEFVEDIHSFFQNFNSAIIRQSSIYFLYKNI